MAFDVTVAFAPPQPVPLGRGPVQKLGQQKLAFIPGRHPAFEGEVQVVDADARYGLALTPQSNTIWAGAFRGKEQYPREIRATNRPAPPFASTDSVTHWTPETGKVGVRPLSSRPMNANFVATDPQQFQSNGGGFLAGMGGGGVSLQGMVPSGAWSFVTPGTAVVSAVYRQQYKAMVAPTMTTKDLQASTIYNPLPSFGTVVPRLP